MLGEKAHGERDGRRRCHKGNELAVIPGRRLFEMKGIGTADRRHQVLNG